MTIRQRLLVTGGSGFLGRELCSRAAEAGWDVTGTYYRHPTNSPGGADWVHLDVGSDESVEEIIDWVQPDVVIHTAYAQNARAVTCGGTKRLVYACLGLENQPYFIQVSTDLVFDGVKGFYNEADEAVPLLDYGRDKLDAEQAVRGSLQDALVVRASLMYDLERLPQHLEFATRALAEGQEFFFFSDEFRSPVLVGDLAAALLALAVRREPGLLHIAGCDRVDRWWFGRRLMNALGLAWQDARPASFRERGMNRPADCSLDSSRAQRLLGMRFQGAREVLGQIELDGGQ